jgi:hypothetical protein
MNGQLTLNTEHISKHCTVYVVESSLFLIVTLRAAFYIPLVYLYASTAVMEKVTI